MSDTLKLLRLRLRSVFKRKQVEHELDEELQYHLQCQIDDGLAAGLSPEEARYAALRALGAITQNKEECRTMRRVTWIEDLGKDLRYGARMLLRNPAFSLVAILALALGIGANTAMFSVVYGMLFRPLPFADADRVAVVYLNYAQRDYIFGTMCVRDYLVWKQNNHAFEDPCLYRNQRMDIGGPEATPEQVVGSVVTANFFSTLGVRPLLGRTFVPGDDRPNTPSLVVLSETIWRTRFGASPTVLGRTIILNGASATVIGVMPAAIRFPRAETQLWTNLPLVPPTRYGPWFYRGLARLKSGVTLEQARTETNNIGQLMAQQNPYYKRVRMPVVTVRDALLGTTVKPAILVMTGAVGLVLLIAVVNVANLLLARATVREREVALRLSLGAGRGRVVRQLLTESVLLAGIGGVAGLALAWGAIKLIRVWNPGDLPLIDSVRLDWGALGFMAFASMLAGILFGLVPALESSRADLSSTIKEGGRTGGGSPARGRARNALVVAEIAISLTLLIGAGLLLRSFINLERVNGGFFTPPEQILTMRISPGNPKYDEERTGLAFYAEVLRRARGVPGVEMAAVTDSLPPNRQGDADSFELEGHTLAPGEMNPVVTVATVGPDYLQALGIPLIKGRGFTDYDNEKAPPVTIVSDGFVRRFFPDGKALGKHVKYGDRWMEIVGVVGNVKYLGLSTDTDPAYYMPFAQNYDARSFLIVRSSGDAGLLAAALRQEIQSIDRGVTLADIDTMEQALDGSVSQPRFNTMLFGLFAGIALVLAAVGIYGLMAYSVAQRSHEIGVRMALGADRADVVRMVVRQGVSLAAFGIVLGLGGAFALTRLLKTMLFGIGVTDGLTFAAAPLGMLLVVLMATSLPALRATRISPAVALRQD
ncbi:MAG: ABC transporter permease [Acidobacteria bacterium]|nr:MAG: ABC transporter permease [Acidobacteriota bacterium]